MTKIRKLIVVGAMALMMMVVALPTALAQDYYYGPYWDPSWLGSPASTEDTSTTTADCDWQLVWVWDFEDEEWELVWACVVD